MNEFLLVLTGAAISLVSSVCVTWLQARYLRRSEVRATARESTRQLTSIFIAERDNPVDSANKEPSVNLTEAEMTAAALVDRRTRERVRALVRLLREFKLPELQELSGLKPERAREAICDHALEILGAHFRAERIPSLPQSVRKILDVEDEALNIHAGSGSTSVSKPAAESPAPSASSTGGGRKPSRRKTTASSADSKSTTKRTGNNEKDIEDSSFWNEE